MMFDILFYQPDIDRGESDALETDYAFADAIESHGKVILAGQMSLDSYGTLPDLSNFFIPISNTDKSRYILYAFHPT